jgi:hypothetical protein
MIPVLENLSPSAMLIAREPDDDIASFSSAAATTFFSAELPPARLILRLARREVRLAVLWRTARRYRQR